MIADTTFLIQFIMEGREGQTGAARTFFGQNRTEVIRTSIICLGEVAVSFDTSADAWEYFQKWTSFDKSRFIVDCSCMSKTITIDDDAYKLLSKLKQGARDSFTQVIRRHVIAPADTCGEILEAMESQPPPDADLEVLERIARERGRRSGGRK